MSGANASPIGRSHQGMVINDPEGFTVRKEVTRKGKKVFKWVDMLKGVAYLFRYKDVSLAANGRYLKRPGPSR